jgi:hypothetical protein
MTNANEMGPLKILKTTRYQQIFTNFRKEYQQKLPLLSVRHITLTIRVYRGVREFLENHTCCVAWILTLEHAIATILCNLVWAWLSSRGGMLQYTDSHD